VGPVEAFTTGWRKSFTYGGKATRAEYWWFFLLNFIVPFALMFIGAFLMAASPSEYFVHTSSLMIAYCIA
jgi:uncharacterized membrane protein YhaH (DUF805 family)|tara:strand:+ start:139 stop:348 length:210 start_codon:yes stop_codon:yes gene_type:complete